MEIVKIELLPVTIPWKRPLLMGPFSWDSAKTLVVRIIADNGMVGISESGSEASKYMGESQDSMMEIIEHSIAPIILGRDPRDTELLMVEIADAVRDNYQARALIDMALHDLKARSMDVPLYQLLGGRSNEAVKLGGVLSSGSPDEVVAEAEEFIAAGFGLVKYKTGASIERDIQVIGALRKAIGDDVKIVVDANGRWTLGEAMYALPRIEEYQLTALEQPTPADEMTSLARLRGVTSVPIWADEAAITPPQLLTAIRMDAVDGVAFKLAQVGGYVAAQQFIAVAKAAGLDVCCGSMVGTGVEANAYAHFLVANEWVGRGAAHENIGPITVHNKMVFEGEDLIGKDLALLQPQISGGHMIPSEGPGIGTELNMEFIREFATQGKAPRILVPTVNAL